MNDQQKKLEELKKNLEETGKAKSLGLEYHGEAAPWLVEQYRNLGRNIEGFEHQTTTDGKHHVYKHHGNPAYEKARRQIAITDDNYKKIPDITGTPDHALIGAKDKEGKDMILYSKKLSDGTTVYVENILDSKKNKGLRLKTMYNKIDDIDSNEFSKIAAGNNKNDLTKAKIIGPIGTGGNPSFAPIQKSAAAATSTFPTGQSNSNIPQSPPAVNTKSASVPQKMEEIRRKRP